MNRIINSIVIVGGGSAGWMTAAYLTKNLPPQIKITVVESSKIGTIGVGEGTQPYTTAFLLGCGLEPKDWMPPSESTYKLGVEFTGWSEEPVFVDNDILDPHILGRNVMMHEYILSKGITKKEYFDWLPAYRMAKANKAPKGNDPRLDSTPGISDVPWDAVHFRADALIDTLKNVCIDKIRHIDDEIVNVFTDDTGVTGLLTKDSGLIHGDLYVDCSGFKSMLLEGALNEPFISIDSVLLCNRAVAIPTSYKDKKEEMFPYTKATAMDAGWRWTIPTATRIGNGYVYSDKFITPEQAENDLRAAIGEWEAPANHLKMKTGTHKNIALKNVYATGLAAAFVEPLEATGITFTTKGVEALTMSLLQNNGNWNDDIAADLSYGYNAQVREIVDFIFLHYYLSTKTDTPFWQAVHDIPLPASVRNVLEKFIPEPSSVPFNKPLYSMFHAGQWFSLFFGFGVYDHLLGHGKASDAVTKYGQMSWETFSERTNRQLAIFPNHSEYLEQWYASLGFNDEI